MEQKKLWDNYKIIGECLKDETHKFVVAVCTRNGFRYLHVREWYFRKGDSSWQAGRDGFTVPLLAPLKQKNPETGKFKAITPAQNLMPLLTKALEEAAVMELADPENEVWYTPKKKEK